MEGPSPAVEALAVWWARNKTPMVIAVNRSLRCQRRRLAIVLALVTLTAGVGAAHSSVAGDHMGMGVAACISVLDAAVAAVSVAAVAGPPLRRVRLALVRRTMPKAAVAGGAPPRARAGPAGLQIFRR